MPCVSCANASILQKRIWQTPHRRRLHQVAQARRESAFLEDEVVIIKSIAGTMSSMDVTAQINAWRTARGFKPRSLDAVRTWAQHHDIPLTYGAVRTANELVGLLGVSQNTIHAWRKSGVLTGLAWGKFWVYTDAELLSMVAREPWRFDVPHMGPGLFRQAVEVAGKRDPWLDIHAFAKAVPTPLCHVIEAIKQRAIPFQQRAGHHGAYRLQASAVGLMRGLEKQKHQTRSESYGLIELARATGVADRTVRWWWRSGFLEGTQVNTRWYFTEAAVVRMLKTYPWLVSTKKVPIRWATVITKYSRPKVRGRWISVPEAARYANTAPSTVLKYVHQGRLDAKHRNPHEWALRKKTAMAQLRQCLAESHAESIRQLELSPDRHKQAA